MPSAPGGNHLGTAAKARRASHARQKDAEMESDRRHDAEKQAREELRPETSICQQCAEADFCYGGLCSLHQEKFRALCMASSSGSSDKPMPLAPLGLRMLQC